MIGIAWVRRALGNLLDLMEKWTMSIISTYYMTTWACRLWSLENKRRSGCSNKISTQCILGSQQSNVSTLAQLRNCCGVHNPPTWILSNTSRMKWTGASDSVKSSPTSTKAFGRSCKRNGRTSRWKSYKRWWNQCATECMHCRRREEDTLNTSEVA